jgi:hypothetical protein
MNTTFIERIMRASRAFSGSAFFEVALDGALLEELEGWPALVSFVERNAPRIVAVEAVTQEGSRSLIYQREVGGFEREELVIPARGSPKVTIFHEDRASVHRFAT